MHKTLLLLIFIALGCTVSISDKQNEPEYFNRFNAYKGFTLQQAKEIHKNFDYDFDYWLTGGGGDTTRYVFLHMSEFFLTTSLNPKGKLRELPVNLNPNIDSFIINTKLGEMSIGKYIQDAPVDGIVIIKNGKIVFEAYPRMYWDDKHIWFSVSKTLAGTAVAILEDRGMVDVQLPINQYLTALDDTQWEGIPVRDILDMASGMTRADNFKLEKSNFLLFYQKFGFPNLKAKSEHPIEFLKTFKKLESSGEKFRYSSCNTELLAWLVEELTQERFSDFIEREVWQKAGVQFNGDMVMTSNGDCFSAGGMISTLRDLARYGLLFVPSGRKNTTVISDQYLDRIQRSYNSNLTAKSWFSSEMKNNAYQWDEIYDNGDFFKLGHNAQGLYISPSEDVVIAFFGTKDTKRQSNQLPLISRQLIQSGILSSQN